MSSDDLVIVDLAYENALLREQVDLLDAYRWELHECLERLGEKMRELETAHRENARLRDHLRVAMGKRAA